MYCRRPHAAHAGLLVGEIQFQGGRAATRLPRADRVAEIAVGVRERLVQAFGMGGGQMRAARGRGGGRRHVGGAAPPGLRRREGARDRQRLRLVLTPGKRLLLAVHADAQAVVLARRDLRGEQHAARALLQTQKRHAVVVERSVGEAREVAQHRADLQSRHVLQEVRGVHADVGHAAGDAVHARIALPFLARGERLRPVDAAEGTLRVLHHDLRHAAEVAAGDEVARELHGRVAHVRVHEAEHAPRARHARGQFLGLGGVARHRLLAHHVEASLQARLRDFEMRARRRADAHEIRALARRARRLAGKHLLPGAVRARGVEPQLRALFAAAGRIRAERARHELHVAVEPRGRAVNLADEGTDAATDHRHLEFFHGEHYTTDNGIGVWGNKKTPSGVLKWRAQGESNSPLRIDSPRS